MRIRGKKPWMLIEGKIVRFKTVGEFNDWFDADIRRSLADSEKLEASDYFTIDQVKENLRKSVEQRSTRLLVTRKKSKKRIRRRRLWPA